MKVRLLTGKDQILTPLPKARRDVFPAEVKQIAREHWLEHTIPEPAVQRRMIRQQKQLKEGEQAVESTPTRWQHLTSEEQYANFKEDCKEKVKAEMEKKVVKDREKVMRRSASEDKERRLERLKTLSECFPGPKWYSEQKPDEVKTLVDHTTGLGRVCEATSLNYQTLSKALKRLCACKTRPNWICLCQPDGDGDGTGDDMQECQCGCSCDDCLACQV